MRRIVLVRPAVEAGERLGFLPGDMAQKVDPYLRPMYDALYEMLGFDRVARNIERQVIEIAPLAFMRGRSLNDSFIILDEAQNTTVEQMKMFLTRIGFGSKAVVTGDITQIDLPRQQRSGLKHVIDVLRDVEGVAFTFFDARDVVRHPLVQRIVLAYERDQSETEWRDVSGGGAARTARRNAVAARRPWVPGAPVLRRWARAAYDEAVAQPRGDAFRSPGAHAASRGIRPRVCIRVVTAAESRRLNRSIAARMRRPTCCRSRHRRRTRARDGALGDLAICAAVVARRRASRARPSRRTGRTWWCTACCTCSATTTAGTPRRAHGATSRWKSCAAFGYENPYRGW